jgi:hypothetical protein
VVSLIVAEENRLVRLIPMVCLAPYMESAHMTYRDDLEGERRGILERLFSAKGRGITTDPDERRDIHRLGTIEHLLTKLFARDE